MFENTYLVTDKLTTFSAAEVDAAEARLETQFPEGYREYMTAFGKGEYCSYLNVFAPQIIVQNQLGAKPPLEEFCDLWDGAEFGISPERLAKAILLASSMSRDWVVFEPGIPEAVYVLPESEDVIYKAGATLMDALTWLCEPNWPKHRPRFRYFNSGINQKREKLSHTLRLSLDKFRNWLVALGEYNHLEEIWDDNPGVSSEIYVLLKGRMDLVSSELGQIMAFYQSFGGYVSASVDGTGNVSAQVVHDADKSSDTMKQIVEYLQSRAA